MNHYKMRIKELERELDALREAVAKIEPPPTHRVCSKCKVEKPLEEFSKDKTKTLGYKYTCKDCISKYQKAKLEDRKLYKYKQESKELRDEQMMTDEAFRIFYEEKEIKEAIVKCSIRYSKRDKEKQKDLQQIAWGRIAMCKSGLANEYYIEHGEKAIKNYYMREWRKKKYNLEYAEGLSLEEWEMWKTGCMN